MIKMYCRDIHQPSKYLCSDCEDLQVYAEKRLEECPFQEGKTTCVQCPTHCYKKDKREQVRAAMRYTGSRMIYQHPILAIFHIIYGLRKKPLNQIK